MLLMIGPLLVIVGYRVYVGNYAALLGKLRYSEDSFKPMVACHAIIVCVTCWSQRAALLQIDATACLIPCNDPEKQTVKLTIILLPTQLLLFDFFGCSAAMLYHHH